MADLRVFEMAFRATPDACALLDPEGKIAAVNDAWTSFVPAAADRGDSGVGADYLGVCRRAARDNAPRARDAYRALTDVMLRRRSTASVSYPCTLPGGVRWFRCDLFTVGRAGLVGARHVDVTSALSSDSDHRDDDLLSAAPRVMTGTALDLALQDCCDGPPDLVAVVLVAGVDMTREAGARAAAVTAQVSDADGVRHGRVDVVAELDSDVLAVLITALDHHAAMGKVNAVIDATSQATASVSRWGIAVRTSGDTAATVIARARRMLVEAGGTDPSQATYLDATDRSERLHRAADELVTAVSEFDLALARGAPMNTLVDFDRAVLRAEHVCVTAANAYQRR